ncbi:CylF protein [Streptococcus equinus]|uniref:CylF protein n=1 Tax=Streptococcus equinus TaxID=1335 RepID=A0A1H0QPE8_STREI|nr:aminomethyltransferase family protein [Streptococcus equinus]SDP19214.1 CylF protein [Streptococcus equinus]
MTSIYTTLRTDKAYKIYDGYLYEVTGEECEEALDLVLPKNIVFADTETCGYTFLLNEDGSVFDEVTFYKFEDSYWVASHNALDDYFAGLDFEFSVKNISAEYKMVQIEGKNSGEIAQQFYDYDISTLGFRGMAEMTYQDQAGYFARFGFSGEFGYQFFLPVAVFDQFVADVFAGIETYDDCLDDFLRFEVGQPLTSIFATKEHTLYELGYSWNLDFTKEEFRGREAFLAAAQATEQRSLGFAASEKIAAQTDVLFDGQVVGKVSWSADDLSESGRYLGLMTVSKDFAYSGVHFVTADGQVIETLSNPYRIPESWNK